MPPAGLRDTTHFAGAVALSEGKKMGGVSARTFGMHETCPAPQPLL